MSNVIQKESPLHYIKVDNPIHTKDAFLHIDEIAFLGYVNLRGDAKDLAFKQAISEVIDLDIPVIPNSVHQNADFAIYWLSPDEWMITTKEGGEIALEAAIRKKLGDSFFAITNVSGGFTTLNIKGPKAVEILAKGATIDLDPNRFQAGQCAQTQFAKAVILIAPLGKGEYEIIVRRSFAEYLWLYLKEASREYWS